MVWCSKKISIWVGYTFLIKNMKHKISFVLGLCLLTGTLSTVCAWGIWGHEHVNKAAVYALPAELRPFFYNHIDFLTEESTVPDLRKYTIADKLEPPRHYFDLEAFGKQDSIPSQSKDAYAKYDEKFLAKNGILPWYILDIMEKLTKAFKEKRKTEILFLAGDLGHYLGDAHMPLHTTLNHDGQLTNQKGIHSYWESQLPELFGEGYNLYVGEGKYIDNVNKETWRIINASHGLVDTLLGTDRFVTIGFPADKMYIKDDNGNVIKNKWGSPVHSREFAAKYHEAMHGMVENQLRLAIVAISSYWYTAWVNAGKPDLSKMDDPELTKQNGKVLKRELKTWAKGKVPKLNVEKEY
jgi:hypothetical protein